MHTISHWTGLALMIVAALILCQCAAPTSLPAPTQPIATAIPTTPPTQTPQPTPVVTVGWSSHASTFTEMSYRHPGTWIGPAKLSFGEGNYVKDPDRDAGLIIQIALTGNPAELLAGWGMEKIRFVGLLEFEPEFIEDAEPVVVSRITAPSRLARGNGWIARSIFIQRQKDVVQLMWYAPEEQWEEMQTTFADLLASIEMYIKYIDPNLQLMTMYPHDWQQPRPGPGGEGMWIFSNGQTGMLIRPLPIEDPVVLLSRFAVERLEGLELDVCTEATPGDRVSALGGEFDALTGVCQNDGGEQLAYTVSYLPDRDRVLEMIFYAPTRLQEEMSNFLSVMLSMLVDVR